MTRGRFVAGDRWFVPALAAVALLACALRVPVASLAFERDEGEYAYIAARWFAGDVPYRDAFDQKPPAIFAFYAGAFAAFGRSEAAVRWAAQLWSLVGLGAIALLGARIATPGAGIAAAIAGVACASNPGFFGNAVNTEQLAMTPLALGAWAALAPAHRGDARRSLAVGALGGLALLLKPVTLPIVAYQIATAVWRRRSRAVLATAAAAFGLLLPLAVTAGWFAAHGAWHELVDAVLWNNLVYATTVSLVDYPANFWKGLGFSLPSLAPFYVAALAAPLAALRSRKDDVGGTQLGWPAGWLATSLVAVSAGGYFRYHYFALAIPPLALLAGIGLDALGRLTLGSRPAARLAGAGAAAVFLGWAVGSCWWYFGPAPATAKLQHLYGMNPFPEAPGVGRWIAAHSTPEDRVLVYGSEPELLFYADRRSASRYIFVYPATMPGPTAASRQREILGEIDAAPPRFVAAAFVSYSLLEQPDTPQDLKTGLRARLEREYDLVAVAPYVPDRSTPIVEYGAARAAWKQQPLWDGATPWAAFVVWRRRD